MGLGATQLVPVASGTIGTSQVSKTSPFSIDEPPQAVNHELTNNMASNFIIVEVLNICFNSIIFILTVTMSN